MNILILFNSDYKDLFSNEHNINFYTEEDLTSPNTVSIPTKILNQKHDLIVFTGGADIHQGFYNQELRNTFKSQRDEFEELIYKTYVGKVPMFGICRGFQILWAFEGGKLIQHIVPRHTYMHKIHVNHNYRDYGRIIEVNSTHHQGASLEILPSDVHIIATAHDGIPEAFINYNNKVAGVQWHPEAMNPNDPARLVAIEILNKLTS